MLAAIGFSAAALSATLCLHWLISRRDVFLVSWAGGLATLVGGVVLFGALGTSYQATVQYMSFVLIICGFGQIYAGAMQYRSEAANWPRVLIVTATGVMSSGVAYALGYSGIGTVLGNFAITSLLALTAYEFWAGRAEAPVPMAANAFLYALNAFSFSLCGLVLLFEGKLVLNALPENWAEDLNAITLIIGITGIGALSLAMNQSRIARRHRVDAITDPLTGLLNRRALMEQFHTKSVQPGAAVMIFDLDHFKSINDLFGHAAGDLVLRQFARIVTANIGHDDIAARMGGEEFCVVLRNSSAKTAFEIAERIRTELEAETFKDPKGVVFATTSAGFAVSVGQPQALGSLLTRADAALYEAKRLGRNQVRSVGLQIVAQQEMVAGSGPSKGRTIATRDAS
ncbi:GGDEF domain-containing protein [Devosia pacifica]|uniref:diguanylate cyclase n=1 Tax=Devosia pacifica TaxID=1335967 RepID=A0A918SCR6_9HYPH|nr:GGDEF domain-containing protein [Devosia pacifica]